VSLAFYNKAFRLVSLPQEAINWPLSRLATPILAQTRDRPAEFVRAFRHFNLTCMALGLPGVAFLLVSADEIVAVLYGPQWTPVVPLLRALGLMGLFNSFLLAGGWVYTALGTVRRQLHWDVFNLVVLTLSFLVGVHWGALGVALAASATCVVLRIPSLAFCFRGTPLRLRDMGSVLWRPLLATTLAAALVLGVRLAWGTPGPAFGVVLRDGVVFALGYALGWVLVPGWKNFLRHELRRPEPAP
jgi:O-antigen/teichoic acid export membrane protein